MNGTSNTRIDDDPSSSRLEASTTGYTAIAEQQRQQAQSSVQPSESRDAGDLGGVLVISGGTGYNDLVGATSGATFVMPISDDGGSSSEIIRVLGGPSIGDLRSRLVRLIPSSDLSRSPGPSGHGMPRSNDAIRDLLSYRLPTTSSSQDIKQEWMDILEGRHRLWRGIEPERKECIRGFLVHFESEILRRAHRNFDFRGGSIGNFFLAAAQKFFRSIQSAIFLFSAITYIQSHSNAAKVLPVINTNHTATIAAELENGQVIVGQCEISHPAARQSVEMSTSHPNRQGSRPDAALQSKQWLNVQSGLQTPSSGVFDPFATIPAPTRFFVGNQGDGLDPGSDGESDDDGEGSREISGEAATEHRTVKRRRVNNNIIFSKSSGTNEETRTSQLPSKIQRIFYVNAYGNEVEPAPNPEFAKALSACQTLVYSCGSLWTSIVPCLVLRGIGDMIVSSQLLQYKILILNTRYDRETDGLTAMDFVEIMVGTMTERWREKAPPLKSFVTHIIYSPSGQVPCDVAAFAHHGIECVAVDVEAHNELPGYFSEQLIRQALQQIVRVVI